MAETKEYNIKINGIKENIDGMKSMKSETTNYATAMREATKQVREIQGQMVGLEKSSKAWKELAKQAGDLKDRIDDIRQATNRWASDTKKLDDVINLAQSATAAFTLVKGAMSAFGMETEEAEKAIQKLAGAMSIIQSLQTLQNTLKGSTATATLLTKSMNLLSLGMKGTTTASKVLRIALASIGIGLVITAVSLLVEHWEDLCNWMNKSFPIFNKCGGFFNTLKAAAIGLGSAIINWVTNPYKTLADVLKKLFSGDFAGALEAAQAGIKKQFQGTVDAFNNGFKKQVERGLEEITLKSIEEDNKRTKHNLEMLKAKKGNEAKYSKEGIALQKKDFEQRKKLAKGNQDELDKIAVEEANFYRECQESKSAAAKKAADEATKAAKKRAEEERKEEEKRQKLHSDALKSLYEAEQNMAVHEAEQRVKEAEKVVEQFKDGPEELLTKAIDDLTKAQQELLATQVDSVWVNAFENVKSSVSSVTTDLESFKETMIDVGAVIGEKGEGLDFNIFKDAAKDVEALANLSEDELKIVYASYLDIAREFDGTVTKINDTEAEAAKKTEESVKRIREQDKAEQEKILRLEMDAIELTTLKFEEEEDKKSENAQRLLTLLNSQWDTYLAHVKGVYTEDSKQFIEAQRQKQKSVIGDSKTEMGSNKFKYKKLGSKDNPFGNFEIDFEGISKTIEDAYDAYAAPIVEGLGDTIHMMMEFAIEEAQDALDEATEIHDKAVEKVDSSKTRLNEINTEMADASASRLEKLKEQQADEMLLLAQREAEEKRADREKERKENELEQKKKRQRKLELKVQMVEALASGALAAINGFATKPFVPVGLAMGALATTLTAVQLGVMAKQMSKLASGGVLGGREHKDGGNPVPSMGVEVEKGEAVINKRSTAKYLPLLDAINAEGNGGKHTLLQTSGNVIRRYANGGVLNYQRIDDNFNQLNGTSAIQRSIESIDMHPVVEVVQIAKGLNQLSSVREMAGGSKLLKA